MSEETITSNVAPGNPASADELSQHFQAIKSQAVRALAQFKLPSGESNEGDSDRYDLNSELPLPDLSLYALEKFLGFKRSGPFEKMRWVTCGRFDDTAFSFSLEKFGPRLYIPAGTPPGIRDDLVDGLKKAAGFAEIYLKELAKDQIRDGNVTIENLYHRFDGTYRFFRDKAANAYVSRPPDPVVHKRDGDGNPIVTSSQPYRPQIEGGYYSAAMLDAFFSRLEHLMVLVLPFTDFDPSQGNLVEFVGSAWGAKWKKVFDLNVDHNARGVYEQLKEVKESIRNTLAHGGFEKAGASFLFHVPGLGACPAKMSKGTSSYEFSITPIPEKTYYEICQALDACEDFLENSELRPGILYARSGLDADFSQAFRDQCKQASVSEDKLEEFLDYHCYLDDQHANMDY